MNPLPLECKSSALPGELHPHYWLQWVESNHRPPGYEPGQIPLLTHCFKFVTHYLSYYTPCVRASLLVRVTRFEHATTWSQTRSSTRLSYTRKICRMLFYFGLLCYHYTRTRNRTVLAVWIKVKKRLL